MTSMARLRKCFSQYASTACLTCRANSSLDGWAVGIDIGGTGDTGVVGCMDGMGVVGCMDGMGVADAMAPGDAGGGGGGTILNKSSGATGAATGDGAMLAGASNAFLPLRDVSTRSAGSGGNPSRFNENSPASGADIPATGIPGADAGGGGGGIGWVDGADWEMAVSRVTVETSSALSKGFWRM